MIRLFPDEVILYQSGDGSLVLTSHRVSYEYEGWGDPSRQAVLLEQIICCDSYLRKDIITLVLTIGFVISGLLLAFDTEPLLAVFMALLALLSGLLHLLSRRYIIVIYAPAARLRIDAGRMDQTQITTLISRIEEARDIRQHYLARKGIR